MWIGIFCHVIWQDPYKLVFLIENCKSFRKLMIFFHFLWFITFLILLRKASCLFPVFSFLFPPSLLLATWTRSTSRRSANWTPSPLPLLVIFLRPFLRPLLTVAVFFWCISLLYMISVVWFFFNISHNSFGSAGLAPSFSRGENQKRAQSPRN